MHRCIDCCSAFHSLAEHDSTHYGFRPQVPASQVPASQVTGHPARQFRHCKGSALMLAHTPKTITRSRNGCAVCKSKRLKCDEAQPSCSRCKRLGIQCPGYKKPLKWAKAVRIRKEETTPWRSVDSEASPEWTTVPSTTELGLIDWTVTPEQLESTWPDDCTVGFDGLEPLEQYANTADYSNTDTTLLDHGNLWPAFPLDESAGDADLQLENTPVTVPSLLDQECDEDESWPTTILVRPKSGAARQPTELDFPIPLLQTVQDNASILVEYYFKEVCGMMSCYDSVMNPYRTTISNMWSGSQSLYYVIQSMAAACLSGVSRSFSSVGCQLRDQAAVCLSREAQERQVGTSGLLSLVMYGMSLSWHDPSSVGQAEFETLARLLLSPGKHGESDNVSDRQQRFFFYNSLVYWQMLLAFVTDHESNIDGLWHSQSPPPSSHVRRLREVRMPHPQTGIGIDVQRLVAKVGRLVRRERRRIHSRRSALRHDLGQAKQALHDAKQLYSELCAIELPWESSIINSGDESTPAVHLLKIAEAYRCTGILQLYRAFPDLLSPHIRSFESTNPFASSSTPCTSSTSPSIDGSRDTWLLCLALHIIDLVQDIPLSSRSRSIQPLLLVSICSELAVGRNGCAMADMQRCLVASIVGSPRFTTAPNDLDVLRARQFLVSRLSSFENILAAKPIRQMVLLVNETWSWLDDDQQDVYWMDVMIEKGYETLMG